MTHATPLARRSFLKTVALASLAVRAPAIGAPPARRGIKLGMDNFAVRAMGWKAPELIDYAASPEARHAAHLRSRCLRIARRRPPSRGEAQGGRSAASSSTREAGASARPPCASKRTGAPPRSTCGSVCASRRRSARPSFAWSSAPPKIARREGGIRARIADTVKVLQEPAAQQALDAGVKIAVENHAGDMHSWELRRSHRGRGHGFRRREHRLRQRRVDAGRPDGCARTLGQIHHLLQPARRHDLGDARGRDGAVDRGRRGPHRLEAIRRRAGRSSARRCPS